MNIEKVVLFQSKVVETAQNVILFSLRFSPKQKKKKKKEKNLFPPIGQNSLTNLKEKKKIRWMMDPPTWV